jgi:hypothetical protein
MKSEWPWWLGEAATGIMVGFSSSAITGEPLISILYGVFTSMLFFILREHTRATSALEHKVGQWEDNVLGLVGMASYGEKLDDFVQQEIRLQREALVRLANSAKSGEIVIRSRSVQQVAIDLLKQAKAGDKVFATSYVNPDIFWCTPEGQLYRQACFDLCNHGVEITRVFIERARADEREKQSVIDEMKRQKRTKDLKLRKTLESRLPTQARKDMLLIPGRFVAYLGIGTGDVLEEVRVCTAAEQIERAKKLVADITTLSDEYQSPD